MFDLTFVKPQNFASYRQAELDNARVPTFGQMAALPYISNRFAMSRFLGLTEEEIKENEILWQEENGEDADPAAMDPSAEMRSAGISGAGIGADLGALDTEVPGDDLGDAVPQEGTAPETATSPPEAGETPPAGGAGGI